MSMIRVMIVTIGTLLLSPTPGSATAAEVAFKHPGKSLSYGQPNTGVQEARGIANSHSEQKTEDHINVNRPIATGNPLAQDGSTNSRPSGGQPLDQPGSTGGTSYIGCPCDGNGI